MKHSEHHAFEDLTPRQLYVGCNDTKLASVETEAARLGGRSHTDTNKLSAVVGGSEQNIHPLPAAAQTTLATTSCVLVHPEMGVYLGCAMGLGFWSKLDPAGQDSAVTFPSHQAALDHAATWETQHPGLTTVKVKDDSNGWASIKSCVASGVDAWDPNAVIDFDEGEKDSSTTSQP